MKSSDIIDAANSFIETKRQEQNVDSKGHLVLKIQVENKLGQYKRYMYRVFFVNKNLTPSPVGDVSLVLPVKDGLEDENYRQMDRNLTELMFRIFLVDGWLKHFILGDYGTDG